MMFSVVQAFVGRDEKRAPLKTPAWEARGKCDISHFSREYVLVKGTHPILVMGPSLWFLHVCLGRKTLY